MESKKTVHKRKRHEDSKRGKATQLSSPARKWQTQNDWKKFYEKNLSEAAVLLERDLEDRAKTTSIEIVRIRHVILGTHPNVSITKHNRDAHSVNSAYSGTKRGRQSAQQRDRKNNGGNGFVALLKNSRQLGCVSKDIEQPKSKSIFHRMAQNPSGQSAACNSQKSTLRHVKIVKERVIARCDSALRFS